MKITILDVYADRPYRVSKDTNGGFGTGNDYGTAPVPALLKRLKKRVVDFPPLSAAYVAGELKRNGHEAVYIRNTIPDSDTDLVLVISSIVEHTTEIAWIRQLKSMGFHVGVIGPFANALPDRYLEHADFLIPGEPEAFFHHPFERDELHGYVRPKAPAAIDDLAMPDWDICDPKLLKYGLIGGGRFAPMLASRGCPHTCRYYCTYPFQQGKVTRRRSPEAIADEMAWLQKKWGVSRVLFRDPIFGVNNKWALELAARLRERQTGIKFVVETHLNSLTSDIVEELKSAGLTAIKTGVENADSEILKQLNRNRIDVDYNRTMIDMIHRHGIKVMAFYILGMPDDTYESSLATIRYASHLNTYGAQFSVATPYPGTQWYEDIKDKITATRFDEFTQFSLVWNHPALTYDDIERLKNKAYTSFYLRMGWGKRLLCGIIGSGNKPIAPRPSNVGV